MRKTSLSLREDLFSLMSELKLFVGVEGQISNAQQGRLRGTCLPALLLTESLEAMVSLWVSLPYSNTAS